jgi:membrane protein YqaA with SNARE-associated domain
MKRGRLLVVAATAVVAIAAVSSTLGRQIYAGQTPGLLSFGLIHFAGYLFFLLMPVEALVPVYQAEGHPEVLLVGIAVGTALLAQAVDYGIGRAFSDRVITGFIGEERYERFRQRIQQWGGWAILVFNLFPLSSPNMLLVAGIVRYSAGKAFVFSLAGLLGKYVGMVYIFDFISWWASRGGS